MLNRFPRYLPLLRILEQRPGSTILEIGSGSIGLAEFQDGHFVGCDVSFPEPPAPGMMPVAGAGEALPFRPESFDVVVCQDTLEHLPPERRGFLLDEAVRVSRGIVYVSFPRGRLARLADRAYAWYHRRIRRWPLPEWLSEHLSLPPVDPGDVRSRLEASGEVRSHGNENVLAHVLLLLAEHWGGLNRRLEAFAGAHPAFTRVCFRALNCPPTYRHAFMLDKAKRRPGS